MLFRTALVALVAATAVAAMPWHMESGGLEARAQDLTRGGRKKYLGAPFSPKTVAAHAAFRKKKGVRRGGNKNGQGNNGNAGKVNGGNGQGNNGNNANNGGNNGNNGNNGGNNNNDNNNNDDVGDTGIANVIELCRNPDGVTNCAEILGDTKGSCFTIPEPFAGDIKFFLPAPNSTCTLFADEDCTKGEIPADGVIKNINQLAWACDAAAA